MLKELRIRNFAIIEEIVLVFEPGLFVLTGETGAGKSIIVDAIEMLLGGRGDSNVIRSGEETASVEGDFVLDEDALAEAQPILDREGLWDGEALVSLGREVRREGRNIARVNGRTVNLAILRDIGQILVDVHGQSEHLSLLRVREHLRLLDRFGGLEEKRAKFSGLAAELQRVRGELERIRTGEREAARRADMLQYQIGEIEAARVQPGEEAALVEERTRLANAEQLAQLSDEAIAALDAEGEENRPASDLLGEAVRALGALSKIDPSMNPARESGQAVLDQAAELARDLRAYRESIEFNPRRLEQVEERVELLGNLKRKYGETLEAVVQHAERARTELEGITHADERRAELEAQEKILLTDLGVLGAELSRARRNAADQLAQGIETELADLKMAGAKFSVDQSWREDPEGAYVGDKRVAFDFDRARRHRISRGPESGRRAQTAGEGGLRRRDLAVDAGDEKRTGPRGSDADVDLRRDRPRHRGKGGHDRRKETVAAYPAPSGPVRHPPAATGGLRRPAPACGKNGPGKTHANPRPEAGRPGANFRARLHAGNAFGNHT